MSAYPRRRVVSNCSLPVGSHKTQQQFRDECDLNIIVAKAQRGIAPRFVNAAVPRYGDFSSAPSLAEAHEVLERAREAFMTLPSKARAELGNDFTNLTSVDHEFFVRHGLTKPAVKAGPGEFEGVVDPLDTKPVKRASKAVKAASSDQDGQD